MRVSVRLLLPSETPKRALCQSLSQFGRRWICGLVLLRPGAARPYSGVRTFGDGFRALAQQLTDVFNLDVRGAKPTPEYMPEVMPVEVFNLRFRQTVLKPAARGLQFDSRGFPDHSTRCTIAAVGFMVRTAQRILDKHSDEITFNYCPRCGGLAKTPKARQCRFCDHGWHSGA